jgi:chemotaxis signal transduction protein
VSEPDSLIQEKVAGMRRHFDEAFAAPPPEQAEPLEPLLAIRVEGERLAIRLRHISGLSAARGKILSVPGSVPELIGITAFRGSIVPLFSLSRLLGFGGQGADVRWIVLAGEGAGAVALGFEGLEGYLQVDPAGVFSGAGQAERPYVTETARHDGVLRGIVDVRLLAERVRKPGFAPSPA